MHNDSSLSRRQWLGHVSLPVIAASLGSSFVASQASAQTSPGATGAGSNSSRDEASPGARIYDVRAFGAKGDGTTLDTAAVQAAIDACHQERGGTVLIPAGDFVIGTIELRSNVTIHLVAQGKLLGSPKMEDYRAGTGVPSGNGNIVMIYAANAENVTIEGHGTIDGNGAKFYTGKGDNTGPGQNSADGYFGRPHLIIWYKVKNLVVRDVFLTASAYHCMRTLQCERVYFDSLRIYNRVNKNNDGFHLQSTQHAHIVNCDVKCQDDACALFGSCKFITVTNCTFSTRWAIFRFGGGEAENITVSNCVIYETYGCVIKMAGRSGSRYENMSFSNLIMKDVTGPITVGLNSARRSGSSNAPVDPNAPRPKGIIRNISFNNIRATVVGTIRQHADLPFPSNAHPGEVRACITVNGVGDDIIENVSFNDVYVTYEGGGTAEEAAVRNVPQVAGEYFQIGTPPAYGIFARNVRGLTVNNVRLAVQNPDLRPAVVFDHVTDATVSGLSAQGNDKAESLLRFIETQDTLITSPRVTAAAPVFLQVEGAASGGITVEGGDISKAPKALSFAGGAKESSVKLRG
jgi:polygalacturonase